MVTIPLPEAAIALRQFQQELIASFETLGGIAELYGSDVLVSLLYLEQAIMASGFSEAENERVLADQWDGLWEVLAHLPSYERWVSWLVPLDQEEDYPRRQKARHVARALDSLEKAIKNLEPGDTRSRRWLDRIGLACQTYNTVMMSKSAYKALLRACKWTASRAPAWRSSITLHL